MATNSGPCSKCGIFRNSLHRDHIIPKWRGGLNVEANIQLLCANCHEDKTNQELQTPEYKLSVSIRSRGNTYALGHIPTPENLANLITARRRWYQTHSSPLIGTHHTDATKAKMSAAGFKRWSNPEERAKRSIATTGSRNGMYGKHLSTEARHKISEAQKKRYANRSN